MDNLRGYLRDMLRLTHWHRILPQPSTTDVAWLTLIARASSMNRLSPTTSKHLSEIRVATHMVIDLALDAW